MHGRGCCQAGQADGRRRPAGCGDSLIREQFATWSSVAVSLAGAEDHGVHSIENDREQHPEDRGKEEAANDIAYRVGVEEAH